MPIYLDKLHTLTIEKAKFDLAKAKLEREAWLVMINLGRPFIRPTTSNNSNSEISKTSRKVFAFAPQFASLPEVEISENFQNRFRLLNLRKLRHLKSRNNICWN